jgi:hypothetical protein
MKKTFKYDFQNKEFVVRDGKLVPVDDITIWIEKILRTEKLRYAIYENTTYGVSLEDLVVGQVFNKNFTVSELQREIEDALLQHPQIIAVQNLRLTSDKIIDFEVILSGNEPNSARTGIPITLAY